jgi:hypothetical protein
MWRFRGRIRFPQYTLPREVRVRRAPWRQALGFAGFVGLAAGLWLPPALALLIGMFVGIIAVRSTTHREENRP